MESLPREMFWEIAQYLTAEDLSVCCLVSRRWRDIFSHDTVWRPRCDPSLEEYLRTTPCSVKPGFVTPKVKDTLSPVGHWRLAFMRENHLWKNWQQGNSIGMGGRLWYPSMSDCGFLGNDNALFINDDGSIHLCNLFTMEQKKSQLKCLKDTHYISVKSNFGILIKSSGVQVVFIGEKKGDLVIKFNFFFDEPTKLLRTKLLDRNVKRFQCRYSEKFGHVAWFNRDLLAVVGTVFVGILPKQTDLHIWDLETGEKLKTAKCPSTADYTIRQIVQSRSSEFIVLILMPRPDVKAYRTDCVVYDFKHLSFIPFRAPVTKSCYMKTLCAIYKHYIALMDVSQICVYNCLSSDLIYKCDIDDYRLGTTDNFFVFNHHGWTHAFNPIDRTCSKIYHAEFSQGVNEKFLQLEKEFGYFNDPEDEGELSINWLIKRSSTFRKFVRKDCYPRFNMKNLLNHSFTRLLSWSSYYDGNIDEDCFW